MSLSWGAAGRILWTGLFAIVFTGLVSGVWTGLLLTNLRTSPALPWSPFVLGALLWAAWTFLGGAWGPAGSRAARRELLRDRALPAATLGWAVAAGVLWVIALAGLWIVLHRLAPTQGNPLPDFSRYPPLTTALALVGASISGGASEEAGFRGYFQGTLERLGLGWGAPVVAALVMAPEHALTQGFVWQNLLFYLLVDLMLGALARLTGSIRPGVMVHAAGLLLFFTLVWPGDAHRPPVAVSGYDQGFWLAVAGMAVFAVASLAAFGQLAKGGRAPA